MGLGIVSVTIITSTINKVAYLDFRDIYVVVIDVRRFHGYLIPFLCFKVNG